MSRTRGEGEEGAPNIGEGCPHITCQRGARPVLVPPLSPWREGPPPNMPLPPPRLPSTGVPAAAATRLGSSPAPDLTRCGEPCEAVIQSYAGNRPFATGNHLLTRSSAEPSACMRFFHSRAGGIALAQNPESPTSKGAPGRGADNASTLNPKTPTCRGPLTEQLTAPRI